MNKDLKFYYELKEVYLNARLISLYERKSPERDLRKRGRKDKIFWAGFLRFVLECRKG